LIHLRFLSKCKLLLFFIALAPALFGQESTWVDSLDIYSRTAFLPAEKYHWTWQNAALLNAIKVQHEMQVSDGLSKESEYLDYLRTAMDRKLKRANGRTPNAVASGLGMAFLARATGEEKYKKVAAKIYSDYNKIPKTDNGGVSHLKNFKELWDDTIFMVGCYLREMYLLTGDEKYLNELLLQVELHREKLKDDHWGLWYHGWDGDNKDRSNLICGQKAWSDNPQKRSAEIWGRGNGWVVVTLAETVSALEDSIPQRKKFATYLEEMLIHLPALQDSVTGHWYQLPVRKSEEGNFIESSCTAMFGYGILIALKEGIVEGATYEECVKMAFNGLREHSIQKLDNELRTMNVCNGTCIGDKDYYFNRRSKNEKSFGLAMFILFGRAYLQGE